MFLEWGRRGDGAQGRSAASGRITGRHGGLSHLLDGAPREGSQLPEARRTAWVWVGYAISGDASCSRSCSIRCSIRCYVEYLQTRARHHDLCAAHLEKINWFIWPRADSPRCILFAFSDLARPRVQNQPTQRALITLHLPRSLSLHLPSVLTCCLSVFNATFLLSQPDTANATNPIYFRPGCCSMMYDDTHHESPTRKIRLFSRLSPSPKRREMRKRQSEGR